LRQLIRGGSVFKVAFLKAIDDFPFPFGRERLFSMHLASVVDSVAFLNHDDYLRLFFRMDEFSGQKGMELS